MAWIDIALPRSKRYEALRLVAYLCPAGVWTVGYGATGGRIGPGTVWTQEQAERDLRDRFEVLGRFVDSMVHVELTPAQKAALTLLIDNIGRAAFNGSTLLKKLNAGDYKGAAAQFERWNRGGGKVLPGLVRRRAEERALFEGRANGG